MCAKGGNETQEPIQCSDLRLDVDKSPKIWYNQCIIFNLGGYDGQQI